MKYKLHRREVKQHDRYEKAVGSVPVGRFNFRRIQDAGNRRRTETPAENNAPQTTQAVAITALVFIVSGSAGWVFAQLAPFGLAGRLITQFLPVWGAFMALVRGNVLQLGITGNWLQFVAGLVLGVLMVALHGNMSLHAMWLLPARLVQSGAEETVFRGYLMERVPGWQGVAWSAGLFTLMHAINPGFNLGAAISVTAFGVFAALLRRQTGNIMAAWGFHAGWNLGL